MATGQQDSINLREACVQAAHAVIAEQGVEGLSLRDVARRLGVALQVVAFENVGAMLDALIGVVAGALALGVMSLVARLRSARSAA